MLYMSLHMVYMHVAKRNYQYAACDKRHECTWVQLITQYMMIEMIDLAPLAPCMSDDHELRSTVEFYATVPCLGKFALIPSQLPI